MESTPQTNTRHDVWSYGCLTSE